MLIVLILVNSLKYRNIILNMTAYFVTVNDDNHINGIANFKEYISEEFGSHVSDSSVFIPGKINGKYIYGFTCDNVYIKDKYKEIINTEKNMLCYSCPIILIKSIKKAEYDLMFDIKYNTHVYFAIKINKKFDKSPFDEVADIKNIFGSHVATTIKYGEYDVDNYCIAFECHRDYISNELRKIINTPHMLPLVSETACTCVTYKCFSFTEKEYDLLLNTRDALNRSNKIDDFVKLDKEMNRLKEEMYSMQNQLNVFKNELYKLN